MMHAHIYPYTPMHGYKSAKHGDAPTLTMHIIYIHDIRIRNRDAHTDSKRTYVHHPLTCRAQSVRWWRNCSDGEQYRVWWYELVF